MFRGIIMKCEITAIIILNYNNYEDTINCIESIICYNSALVKIIVVDNGSTRVDASQKLREYLLNQFSDNILEVNDSYLASVSSVNLPMCTYIASSINDGYARGNNKGLKLADIDNEITHVMVLNNDVLFIEDIIPSLLKWDTQLSDSAFISPLLLKKDRKSIDYNCARKSVSFYGEIKKMLLIPLEKCFHFTRKYVDSHQILKWVDYKQLNYVPSELLSGSCLFVAKEVFSKISFFDPNTFLYFEEDILYEKTKRIGLQNYLIPSIKCVHIGAQSTSYISKRVSVYSSESAIYYFKHYCGCGKIKVFIYNSMVKWYNIWLNFYDVLKRLTKLSSHPRKRTIGLS